MTNPVVKNVHLRPRKADGIFEVCWLEDGKAKRKTTGTRDEALAKAKLVQIEADIRAVRVPNSPTVGWIIDAYQASLANTKPPHSLKTINSSLRPVKARLGHLRSDQLSQSHVDGYVQARMTDKRWADHPGKRRECDKTIGPSTVDRDLRMLRAALAFAYSARYIPAEIKFKIRVTPSAPKRVWLTKSEVRLLLDACEPKQETDENGRVVYRNRDREHLYTFILLSVATAARKDAVLSLKWKQIHFPNDADLKGEKLVDPIAGKVAGNTYIDFGQGEGNKRRPVMPIGDNFPLIWHLVTLRNYADTLNEYGMDVAENHVITFNGKPVKDVKKGIGILVAECGIKKKVTPHTFKHTAVTWMVEAGMPLSTIADLINTNEEILRRVYSHHRPDYQTALGSALSV